MKLSPLFIPRLIEMGWITLGSMFIGWMTHYYVQNKREFLAGLLIGICLAWCWTVAA